MVPKYCFFTKGVGRHREKLQSFELALRSAEIEKYNLVNVSSIYPPGCKNISKKEGLTKLVPGQIVHVVMSRCQTSEPGRMLVAAVGAAIPGDKKMYGYISEHHAYGMSEREAADYSEDLAACMLASTLGLEFDEDVEWDERKEIWKFHRKTVKTKSITQVARGGKKNTWTTVIAACVLIF